MKLLFITVLSALAVLVVLACLAPLPYGIYLTFKASIVLGVIALCLEPAPWVIGVIALVGRPDVADKIAQWMQLPF